MRTRPVLALAASVCALGLAGVSSAAAAPATVGSDTPSRAAEPTTVQCTYTKAVPADKFQGIPTFDPVKAAQPYDVRLHTNQGTVVIRMRTDKAPCTTFSFRFLTEHRYFDQTHCHRLTTQRIYVLQCGDPTGTGSGGPGYSFPDENLDGATYPAGTVAMANAGPNTNGSQFFFTWADTTLKPNYTPFGTVISGMDVVQKIAAAGEDDQNNPGDGFPNLPVDLHHAQVVPRH